MTFYAAGANSIGAGYKHTPPLQRVEHCYFRLCELVVLDSSAFVNAQITLVGRELLVLY